MKITERIVMVLILLALIGGGAWIYFSVGYKQKEVRDAVARGEYQIPKEDARKEMEEKSSDWRTYFPELVPLTIGSTTVQASVADSIAERIKGLSDTPMLPSGVVKLFVFNAQGAHSIWMKDMNYPIDIIWLEKEGKIVHIEKDVSPNSYPKLFSSPVPAWFVIETNAGFVASSSIQIGDKMALKGS